MLRSVILITLLLLISGNLFASENFRQTIDAQSVEFKYFANDERANTIDTIKNLSSDQWIPAPSFNPYGLVNRNYWLHVSINIDAQTSLSDPLYLEIANPLIDYLEVYLFKGSQSKKYLAGDLVTSDKRPIQTPTFYFPLPISTANTLDIYIQYRDEAASILPLAITNSTESLEMVSNHGLSVGIILGLIIALLMISLILYQKDKDHLIAYYLGFLIVGGISIFSIEGASSIYIWPNYPWLQNLLLPVLYLASLWCSIQLTRLLLTKQLVQFPFIENTLLWLSRAVIIVTPILFALPSFIAIIISIIILSIALIIVFGCLILFTIKSKEINILLLLTWTFFSLTLSIKAIYFSDVFTLPHSIVASTTLTFCLQFLSWGAIILTNYIKNKESIIINTSQETNDLTEKLAAAGETLFNTEQEHLDMEALVDDRTFELNVTLRELQETNRKLQEQATNDALTGVKNRKFFDERLKAEYRLSRRQQTPLSLLILDADKFKSVNDNHGHLVGDEVLIAISGIASKTLKRPNDYVCRYGGEEFAVLLSNTDEKGALKMAEVIRQRIGDTVIKTESVDLQVTVSIGVSTLLIDDNVSDNKLFEQADKALYFAKESGRNNVKSFNELKLSQDK